MGQSEGYPGSERQRPPADDARGGLGPAYETRGPRADDARAPAPAYQPVWTLGAAVTGAGQAPGHGALQHLVAGIGGTIEREPEPDIVFGLPGISAAGVLGTLAGAVLLLLAARAPVVAHAGLQALGPLLGIALIVFSLFGDLPRWISWTQRLGAWLYPGIAIGAITLLLPLLAPAAARESSFWAFSPRVWAAYVSIVLVSLSFEQSSLPGRVYRLLKGSRLTPAVLIPSYIVVAGLLGNLLDGVSIIAISVVIFRRLLPAAWSVRASFALLFGGLLSNFLTVAAEPTNIKFQDVLAPVLDRVEPSYWLTNWPISLLAIALPAAFLAASMRKERAGRAVWRDEDDGLARHFPALERWFAYVPVALLTVGIAGHTVWQLVLSSAGNGAEPPWLALFLLPAGVAAFCHLLIVRTQMPATRQFVRLSIARNRTIYERASRLPETWKHVQFELPVWLKLAVIFSLLWYLANGLTQSANVFAAFFSWPEQLRLGMMSVLSLGSSVTDNVALAAMQGSLIVNHPIAIWQVRLLFILLTWAGGFTPFGCLQSLALNSRLRLGTSAWFKQALIWSALSLAGALAGLALIGLFHPTAVGLP